MKYIKRMARKVGVEGKERDVAAALREAFGLTAVYKNRVFVLVFNEAFGCADVPARPKARTPKAIRVKKRAQSIRWAAPMPEEDFYASWGWKRARYEILKEHGAKCMLCGATRDDGVKICVDHIKPRALYPHLALERSNLQVLCNDCNMGKGRWDETDWRREN